MSQLLQKCYLGVTNYDWFSFLQAQQVLDVNFWKPSNKLFKALQPGELFLFKIKSPYNKIGGGGNFVDFIQFPLDQVWSLFQQGNGANSYSEFAAQIGPSLSKDTLSAGHKNPTIGCILIENTVFFQQEDWLDLPVDWKSNIVSGKSYHVQDQIIQDTIVRFEVLRSQYLQHQSPSGTQMPLPLLLHDTETPRYGKEYLIKPRRGQGLFRAQVTQAYQKTCAITGEHTLPVLQASHIKPYAKGGPHSIKNGILLRSDFHQLFDLGYLTITPDFHIEVSRAIQEEFANGIRYKERHGQKILLPTETTFYPELDFLEWHNQEVFRSSV